MRGINKVILVGTAGKDPETRYTPAGSAVTNISIATSESWKDKQTGEKKEVTEWHNVVFFGKLGEIAGEYLQKSSKVYIEGKLKTEKYTDKNGVDKYSTKVIANVLEMLSSKSDDAKPQAAQSNQQPAPQQQGGGDFSDIPF